MPQQYDVAVVGAGILGLAHAYLFAKVGLKVVVFEKGRRAQGASVRNFGMIWPIGQPPGEMRELAVRSREIWLEILGEAGIWHRQCGSLHLAYREDEMAVLSEFAQLAPDYGASLVTPEQATDLSKVIKMDGLKGGLWSSKELCVDPRQVVSELPSFLESLGVEFRFGTAVTRVEEGRLSAGGEEVLSYQTVLCPGDDMETLFPGWFASSGLTRSKLQMLKARPRVPGFQIGPHLCAGLTLGHYANFRICSSLEALLARFQRDYAEHVKWGVHLLVSQHESGDLTIGDSHEYGLAPDPFLREEIDQLILGYLDTFLPIESLEVTERWQGIYCKHPSKSYLREELLPSATVVTGVGGAGMTLSFGLAERTVKELVTS